VSRFETPDRALRRAQELARRETQRQGGWVRAVRNIRLRLQQQRQAASIHDRRRGGATTHPAYPTEEGVALPRTGVTIPRDQFSRPLLERIADTLRPRVPVERNPLGAVPLFGTSAARVTSPLTSPIGIVGSAATLAASAPALAAGIAGGTALGTAGGIAEQAGYNPRIKPNLPLFGEVSIGPRSVGEFAGGFFGGPGRVPARAGAQRIGTNLDVAAERAGGARGLLAAEAGGTRLPDNPLAKMTAWLNESGSALATGRKARQAQVAKLRSRQAGALRDVYGRADLSPQEQVVLGERSLAGSAGETPIGPPPLDEVETAALLTSLRDFPTWQNRPFKALNAQKGLLRLMQGELPAQYELGLLEQVFGPEFVRSAARASGSSWREAAAALGLPRTVRTILDISFPLRQGIAVAPRHPKEVFGNIPRGVLSTFSERAAQQWDEATRMKSRAVNIVDDAGNARSWTIGELQDEVRLFLPRIEQQAGELAERTEEFMATQGGDTWVGRVFGPVTRPFQRNFITLGNATRSDIFENAITSPFFHGGKPVTMEDARALAWLLNVGTGRGDLGPLNRYAPLLSQGLFSPRLIAGRVEHAFSPAILATGAGGAPKSLMASQLAAQQLVSFIGAGVATLAAASQIPGLRVDPNILSSKWGKIEIGYDPTKPTKRTTKIDLFGGYLPYARFIAQLATAKGRSSSGEEYDRKRWDIVENFLRNKAAPNVATVWDLLSQKYGTTGQKVDVGTAAGIKTFLWNEFTPLAINDIVEAVRRDDGVKPQWAFVTPFSLLGGGVQTYGESPGSVLFSMPKYEGLTSAQYKELQDFLGEVDYEYQRARAAGRDFTKAEVAEILGKETGRKELGKMASAAARDELPINKERVQFAIDHQDELEPGVLRSVVPDDILRDYLTPENFKRVFGGDRAPTPKRKKTRETRDQPINPAIPRIGR
jgi:hypothetical protein